MRVLHLTIKPQLSRFFDFCKKDMPFEQQLVRNGKERF